jgi:fructose-1,6-bisphosphatase I
MIALEIMRAGFVGKLGLTGQVNVQQEEVRALDVISNEIFIRVFETMDLVTRSPPRRWTRSSTTRTRARAATSCCSTRSTALRTWTSTARWAASSRSIGARRDERGSLDDFLQKGSDQVAAGYILYGPSTIFVYTAGGPVHGFTLDRAIGEFFLTHSNIQIPGGKGSYAVNEANEPKWDAKTQELVTRFRHGQTRCGARSARYVGALVADFHRTMIQGGIYMYPGEVKKKDGKLRLLYEASPLAMVARQAGGRATDGRQDILAIQPKELHQRTPLFIGAKADVDEVTEYLTPR